jgi:hypothetical protein
MSRVMRLHSLSEWEERHAEGKKSLERQTTSSELWSLSSEGQIEYRTLKSNFPPEFVKKAANFAENLRPLVAALRWAKSRLLVRNETRSIRLKNGKTKSWNKNNVYVDIESRGVRYTILIPELNQALKLLSDWIKIVVDYENLPLWEDSLLAETVVLSNEAFGYILHECLGHRLESDDHSLLLPTKHMINGSFDVWDTPGKPGWPGYVPFDDMGTDGQKIKLLSGKTGEQSWITADSGNLRASSARWHPIIRQRTLDVVVFDKFTGILPPKNTLFIDHISAGTFDGRRAHVIASMQRWQDSKGRFFRLPQVEIQITPYDLKYLKPFGSKSLVSPAGGCAKNNQSELDITFNCPKATMAISPESGIKLKILA